MTKSSPTVKPSPTVETSQSSRSKFQGGGRRRTLAPDVGLFATVKWGLTKRPHRWPLRVEQVVLEEVPERCAPGEVAWVAVGHSTILLQLGSANLLFDPIWSDRCSPVSWAGPRRVRPPAVRFEALPPIDVVLVSHNHYDHCDRATLERLAERHNPTFLTGRGVGEHLQRWGIDRVEELEWWAGTEVAIAGCEDERRPAGGGQTVRSRETVTVDFVPTQHFSSRGLGDRNRTLWGGFWLSGSTFDEEIYFCGDSGWDRALFEELRARKGSPDLAFLPIGAYDPRWFMRPVHVDPEEAVKIHQTLGCARSVAMHCATFQLTDEAIDEPELRLVSACRAAGLSPEEFGRPQFGLRELLRSG